MLGILAALVLAGVQMPAADAVPDNVLTNPRTLLKCKPRTAELAADCLIEALDAEAADQLARGPGQPYREALRSRMRAAWMLDDAASPVAKDLAKKGVYDAASAPEILLAVMGARLQHREFDFARLAKTLRAGPPAVSAASVVSSAPAAAPSMEGAMPVDHKLCERPNAPPGEIIVSCMKLTNGALLATRRTPNAPVAAVHP